MPEKKILEMIVPAKMEARVIVPTSAAWRSLFKARSRKLMVSGVPAQNNPMKDLDMGDFSSAKVLQKHKTPANEMQ